MIGRLGRAKTPSIYGADRVTMLGMSSRAQSSGVMAEAYERFRPGYPVELFDMVMTYAGQPVRTALEIGAGTGKATRLFAQRGSRSPRPSLTGPCSPSSLSTCQQTSRPCKPRLRTCDRARATGWFMRQRRCIGRSQRIGGRAWLRCWSRVACLPRSVDQPQLVDPAAEEAVRAARAPFLESDEVPSPDGTPPGHDMQWPGTELQRSEWFADVQQCVIERRLTMSAQDYVGHLSTISAYLELPTSEQEQVYSQIMQVLPETVEVAADITVHLARRRCEQ